jgi:hypothetical protein
VVAHAIEHIGHCQAPPRRQVSQILGRDTGAAADCEPDMGLLPANDYPR